MNCFYLKIFSKRFFCFFFGATLLTHACHLHAGVSIKDVSELYVAIRSFVNDSKVDTSKNIPEVVIPSSLSLDGHMFSSADKKLMKAAVEQFLRYIHVEGFTGIYQRKEYQNKFPAIEFMLVDDPDLHILMVRTVKIRSFWVKPYEGYSTETSLGSGGDVIWATFLHSEDGTKILYCNYVSLSNTVPCADCVEICMNPESKDVVVFNNNGKIDRNLSNGLSQLRQGKDDSKRNTSLLKKFIIRNKIDLSGY